MCIRDRDYNALTIPATLDLEKTAVIEINAEWYESVAQVYACLLYTSRCV